MKITSIITVVAIGLSSPALAQVAEPTPEAYALEEPARLGGSGGIAIGALVALLVMIVALSNASFVPAGEEPK